MSIEILILCSERHFEMLSPVVKWRGEHCDVRYMLSVAHYDAHRFFLMSVALLDQQKIPVGKIISEP